MMKLKRIVAFSTFFHPRSCSSFLTGPSAWAESTTLHRRIPHTHLGLIPIAKFRSEMNFLDASDSHRCCFDKDGRLLGDEDDATYVLSVVQEDDLPDVSRFVINAFGADAISLSTDLNGFERALMKPTVGMLNAYSGLIAYVDVLSGLRSRTKDRIKDPNLSPPALFELTREGKLEQAARSSLILALGRRSKGSDWRVDVVASVELRLQPCDAKIPFGLPWLDRLERRLALALVMEGSVGDWQPYLGSLCVDEKYRGRKIGKAMVRCVEDIAINVWGYSKLFLHVDLDNEPALKLYQSEDYKDAGRRWNPFWAGKAAGIGYFVKHFPKGMAHKPQHVGHWDNKETASDD